MTSRRPRLEVDMLDMAGEKESGAIITFMLLEVRLLDKSRNTSGEVIDQANCLDPASHNLVFTR